MPRLDGIGATRAIRDGDGLSSRTPIIGLTAHALPEERRKLETAGMDDCIIKPLRSAKVRDIIAALVRGDYDEKPTPPAVHEPSDAVDLIDHETLAELKQALPADLFARQLERFRAELEASKDWLDNPDSLALEDMAATAHKAAGSAAVFGAVALRAALLDVESAARHGASGQVSMLCKAAMETATKTLAALAELTA